MKKSLSILSLLFGLFACVTLFSACGKNEDSGTQALEFKINSEVDEYGVPYYKVGGNGGDINFSFTTNKPWYYKTELNSGIDFVISPDSVYYFVH